MKRAVGTDFMEVGVHRLSERGFSFHTVPQEHGFTNSIFPLKDPRGEYDGFEIHVVHDEIEYLSYLHRSLKRENFHPFLIECETSPSVSPHANTVETFASVLWTNEIDESELRSYLEIRKDFSMAALHLRCRDLEQFIRIAQPEQFFSLRGERAALIHLGPTCFDLIVTAEPAR